MTANFKVESDRIELAYERWCQSFGANEYGSFWKFLETSLYVAHEPFDAHFVSPEGMRKLEMLLGEHHVAIIKAYKARNRKLKA